MPPADQRPGVLRLLRSADQHPSARRLPRSADQGRCPAVQRQLRPPFRRRHARLPRRPAGQHPACSGCSAVGLSGAGGFSGRPASRIGGALARCGGGRRFGPAVVPCPWRCSGGLLRPCARALEPPTALGRLRGLGTRLVRRKRRRRDRIAPFEPLQTFQQPRLRDGGRREQHPCAQQLQQQPGRRGPPHLGEPRVHDLAVPGERGLPDLAGLLDHPRQLVVGGLHQPPLGSLGNRLQQREVAQPLQQVGGEPAGVVPGLHQPVDRLEHGCPIARGQRVDDVVDQGDIGDPEERHRPLVGDALWSGPGEQLVENRQRVARRAASRPDDQGVDGGRDDRALVGADPLHQLAQRAGRDEPERVVVGARADGGQHLVRLRGGEHEDQVLRRLLHDLEQGVETLGGDHVRLVDDEHPVARLRRGEEGAIAQLAGVVHTAVGRSVELGDVDVARTARCQGDARRADAARIGRGPELAVERPRQDARRRRLAAATGTREQVGVVDAARGESRAQGIGDVFLPDHLGELRRAVLAVQSQRHSREATDRPRQGAAGEDTLRT